MKGLWNVVRSYVVVRFLEWRFGFRWWIARRRGVMMRIRQGVLRAMVELDDRGIYGMSEWHRTQYYGLSLVYGRSKIAGWVYGTYLDKLEARLKRRGVDSLEKMVEALREDVEDR